MKTPRTQRIVVLMVAVAAALIAVVGEVALAGSVTGLTTFTSGTTAQASQVNGNFAAVQTAVNDNNSRITTLEGQSKVTSVATGSGLTGGPITSTGTISIANGGVTSAMILDGTITFADWNSNSCNVNTIPKWNGAAWACATDDNSGGTVTNVATGSGLTGGPITNSGTISIASGGVSSAMIADGAVTTPKAKLTYQNIESSGSGWVFDVTTPHCQTVAYTPTTSQVAYIDAAISWAAASAYTGSVDVIYSINGGTSWFSTFANGLWTTNPASGWTSSTKSDAVNLTAGTTYLFAVSGWSYSTAFTTSSTRCALRVIFAAR